MTPHEQAERLREIAGRIEAGESGPEIDRAVAEARGLTVTETRIAAGYPAVGLKTVVRVNSEAVPDVMVDLLPVSTSLDASEALRVRLLPGWKVARIDESAVWTVTLSLPGWPYTSKDATAPTEPAARTAATLRAYAAKLEDDHAK